MSCSSGSYLAGKSPEQLASLLARLSPDVQAKVQRHLHSHSSGDPSSPAPQPRSPSSIPQQLQPAQQQPMVAPQPQHQPTQEEQEPQQQQPQRQRQLSHHHHTFQQQSRKPSPRALSQHVVQAPPTGLVEELEREPRPARRSSRPSSRASSASSSSLALRETPLLSASEMAALLPAVAPEARRYLREVQSGARGVASNQRALRELATFSLRSEKRASEAEAERARLSRLAAQQGQALVVSAHRMHALREKVEVQQRQLELEAAKAKKLERGLRAATRAKPRSSSSSQHLSVRGVGGSSGTESTVRSPQKSTPTDDEVAVDVSAELGEVC